MIVNFDSRKYMKCSFSQCGEDLIIDHIFHSLSIQHPSYIDVGAHHPFYISNTAFFYRRGSYGINIEPDPTLFKLFPKQRPKDINLNIGIGINNCESNFYIMSSPTLNTFSKEEAFRLQTEQGISIGAVNKVPIATLHSIIEKYHSNHFPDFLSLDTEGEDLSILQSIDYSNSPVVICAETISYSINGHGVKDHNLIEYLKNKDYLVYADTNINTIFIKREIWER